MIDVSMLSWPAILAATVAAMAIGALWYSPILFGSAWLAALGKTEDELQAPGPAMAGSVVAAAVSALSVAVIAAGVGANSVVAGAATGAVCGFGLVATAMLSDSLFCGWGWKLYFIQAGYRVAYLVVIGAIVGGWPW